MLPLRYGKEPSKKDRIGEKKRQREVRRREKRRGEKRDETEKRV